MALVRTIVFVSLAIVIIGFSPCATAYEPVPGPDFIGCKLMNYGSTPYAPLPIFNLLVYGGPVFFPPPGSYDFCAYMDTVYCSLPAVESQMNDPRITEFADLILCNSCDMNGPLLGEGENPFTPNGIPDGQYELGLLAGVLNDPTHPLYTTANNAFKYNFRKIKDVLILAVSDYEGTDLRNMLNSFAPHLIGGLAALFAGYATLGDEQTYTAMDELFALLESLGIQPWEGGLGANMWSEPETGPNGDANEDAFSNAIAYHWYVGEQGYPPEDYVIAAIDADVAMELFTLSGGGIQIIGDDVLLESHLIGATPTGPYVWYKGGDVIPAVEGDAYTLVSVTADDSGQYTVEIEADLTFMEDTSMSFSASANIEVLPPDITSPEILECPPNQVANVNASCQVPVPDFTTGVVAQDDRTLPGNLLIVQSPPAGTIVNSGERTIYLTVYDEAGNSDECQALFTAMDVTSPVITLLGNAEVVVEMGDPYTDAGVTATDNCDGNLTVAVDVDGLPVNTNVVGEKIITYNVRDVAYNEAETVTRTVNVVDTTRPYVESVSVISDHTVEITFSKAMSASALLPGNYAVSGSGKGSLSTNPDAVESVAPGVYLLTWNCPGLMKNGGNITVMAALTLTDEFGNVITSPVGRTDSAGAVADIPVITLLGDSVITLECGDDYLESGATAVDACGNDLTASIVVGGDAVDSTTQGTYIVTYNVNDGAMNAALTVTRTITVVDTQPPVITRLGNPTVVVECGSNFTDAGATAMDACDGVLTSSVVTTNPVDTTTPGVYVVRFNVMDSMGYAAAEVIRTVNINDTTPPTITRMGDASVTVQCGAIYNDAGATALDSCDFLITDNIVTTNPVNTSVAGVYTVRYNVSDGSGNSATEVTRSVTVEDTAIPVITLSGSTSILVECGTPYVDPGATAADACDGNLTGNIVVAGGPVDVNLPGIYLLTYNVMDSSGNAAVQKSRTITVADTAAPVISLIGNPVVTVQCGETWNDPGVTALDACDSDLTAQVETGGDVVDTAVLNTYLLIYDVMDSAGIAAVQVQRQVHVVDTLPPVITLNGADEVVVNVGETYTDEGAVASDVCNGDLTAAITVGGLPIDTAFVGTFQVSYNASDAETNVAEEVVRTVYVVDDTKPYLVSVSVLNDREVQVVFSKNMGLGVDEPLNYTISGSGQGEFSSQPDNVSGADAIYTLTWGCPQNMLHGGNITITVNDLVQGISGNTMGSPVSRTHLGGAIAAPPVVTLNGLSVLVVECGDEYMDEGASALDQCGRSLIVQTVNPVDTAVPGMYTLTYDATDGAGNAALQKTRTVTVSDTEAPVITLIGDAVVSVECGDAYLDAGATAMDACDGDITTGIVVDNPVITLVPDVYTIRYNVMDAAGNIAVEVTRTVTVEDTTAPQITLLGDAALTIECGDSYTDAGATALDACDGDITADIVVDNPVNTNVSGVYTIRYTVADDAGLAAQEVTRIVTVEDTQVPVITLTGGAAVMLECGGVFVDAGATAADACDGDLTAALVVGGDTVNPLVPDTYVVTYNVTDGAGLAAEVVTRTVTVADTQAPTISLVGDSNLAIECGSVYTESGATAADACDGDLTSLVAIGGATVDTAVRGAYLITYNVTDSEGLAAQQKIRTVNVVDTLAPVITLTGAALVTIECGTGVYEEAGATAMDVCDGDLTAQIVTAGNVVDTAVPGRYLLAYDVRDAALNTGRVVRVVDVVDTESPNVTLAGEEAIALECGDTYTESGFASVLDICEGDMALLLEPENVPVTIWSAAQALYTSTLIYIEEDFAEFVGNTPGDYVIAYDVLDNAGNLGTAERSVSISDTIPPEIILEGETALVLDNCLPYEEVGVASIIDACDGDLGAALLPEDIFVSIWVVADQIYVNTTLPDAENEFNTQYAEVSGEYALVYSVLDTADNEGTVVRAVAVNCILQEGEGEPVEGEGEPVEGEGEPVEGEGEPVEGEGEPVEGEGEPIEGEPVEGEGEPVEGEGEPVEGEGEPVEGEGEPVEGEGEPVEGEGEPVEGEGEPVEGEGEPVEGEGEPVEGEGEPIEGEPVEGEGEPVEGEGEPVEGEGEGEPVEGEGEPVEGEGEPVEGEGEPVEGEPDIQGDLFDGLDTDDDGRLTYEEAQTIIPGLTQEQFVALDTNKDGVLDACELGGTSEIVVTEPEVIIGCDDFDAAHQAVADAFHGVSATCADAQITVVMIKAHDRKGKPVVYPLDAIAAKIPGFGEYDRSIEKTRELFHRYFLFQAGEFEITYNIGDGAVATQTIVIRNECRGCLGCYSCDGCAGCRPIPDNVMDLKHLMSDWLLIGLSVLVMLSWSAMRKH
jgi:large repetitive protein